MNTNVKEILDEIREQSLSGNRRTIMATLRKLMNSRREYYKQSEAEALLDDYADALYKILLLEMDDEEEESIEIAELAYLGLGTILKSQTAVTPEHYKRRLLLLHYFCDYFTDSIIEVFLSSHRRENLLQARGLAIECLEKMQLADMFYLEENAPDFINHDEQIADACNGIETNPNLSEEERGEAELLHKVLHAYLKAKYKNGIEQ